MRQSCNEQMNMKYHEIRFAVLLPRIFLFSHILQVKLHWMSQSETLEQLVIFRRGLVEVQIAATVATASYRNFSVATKLGKARRLHSWPSWPKTSFHLFDVTAIFFARGSELSEAILGRPHLCHQILDNQGTSLQLDCFCFLGGIGLFNSEAAYDAWRMGSQKHQKHMAFQGWDVLCVKGSCSSKNSILWMI